MRKYYTYILKCADGSYYTGITNHLKRRLSEHNNGRSPKAYTFRRRPLKLVFYAVFSRPWPAILYEKQLKKWSRAKKEALINGCWEELKELAACKNETSHKYFKTAKE